MVPCVAACGGSIMVGPVPRRKSSPQVVQQLWAGIQQIRSQKQIPNIDRLVRYMTRNQGADPVVAGSPAAAAAATATGTELTSLTTCGC
jgi:hypothetical protein